MKHSLRLKLNLKRKTATMPSRRATIKRGAALILIGLGLYGGGAHASTFTVLYSFTDGSDGGEPDGGVIADENGTLYGETYTGGKVVCTSKHIGESNGCGTLYSFTKGGRLKVLVNFTGPNGAYGNNGLTLAGTKLYGSTVYGGANDDGVLFSLNTDGTGFTLLHHFNGLDGLRPAGKLVVGSGGILYGLTQYGGSGYPTVNDGVLFSLTPGGVYTMLHSFSLKDGTQPDSLLMSPSGMLVGSTYLGGPAESSSCHQGCGTVFSYSPATGQFSSLFSLPSSEQDGEEPYLGSFGPGPTIFGASSAGIFSLNMKNGFSVSAPFTYLSGNGPYSGPINTPGQTLYGVTYGGPPSIGYGTFYSVRSGSINTLFTFGGSNGGFPEAQPIRTPSGTFIGTASALGACYDCGTIWEYTPTLSPAQVH